MYPPLVYGTILPSIYSQYYYLGQLVAQGDGGGGGGCVTERLQARNGGTRSPPVVP
jgi:hypothetical protein